MDSKEHPKLIEGLTKNQLKDFNIEEARGWIIDCSLQIEYKINSIIVDFFKPIDKVKFEKIVLNSSIIDTGSKLKILMNIGTIDSSIIEKIRKLVSIRNGFAHAPIFDSVKVNINKDSDSSSVEVESIIEVMNSQGLIKTKIAYDYLVEFLNLYKEIMKKI